MTEARSGDGVIEIAKAVRSGQVTARAVAIAALDAIRQVNPRINAVTRVLRERALDEAEAVDAAIAVGSDPGPLAGVPYGVKDLFDVRGLSTTAGAGRLRWAPSAITDAEAIVRLHNAGAVLVATLNMDEYAYGFVTDNVTWGTTRNPHNLDCFAGGSSGGSAAIVAAGVLPFSLASDTNGSIRIPASLCGIFGIKPTHASLPMAGVYPFVHTLDDMGIMARDAADLAAVDSVIRGASPAIAPLKDAAILGGWFQENLAPEMQMQLSRLGSRLEAPNVSLPNVRRARSAAYLITAYEGGQQHLADLSLDAMGYDPATRDRLIAGAAIPEAVYRAALGFREEFRANVYEVLSNFDVLIAPATYGPAPAISHPFVPTTNGEQPARANLGLYTQPISFIGLPVVAAPLPVDGMPCGIQLIGRPGSDQALLGFAQSLARRGMIAGTRPASGRVRMRVATPK